MHSVLAAPVWNRGRLAGVLKVATLEPHHFGPTDLTLTAELADDVNAALQSYCAADERAAAAALQRSLVPTSLPVIDGLDLAGRYVPGQGGVSGDWYDVCSLPSGGVGIVIGDVAGARPGSVRGTGGCAARCAPTRWSMTILPMRQATSMPRLRTSSPMPWPRPSMR